MNCAICGKEFGLWARISGGARDQVCRDCERIGRERIEAFLAAPLDATASGIKAALARLGAFAQQYRIPEREREALQARALEKVFAGIDARQELDQELILYMAELTKERSVPATPTISGAVQRILRRWTIQRWEAGQVPQVQCQGLLLDEAETCHWEEPARLYEQRTRREYAGGYGGVSVRLARGIRLNTGAFRGYPIDTSYLADAGDGTLHITSERLAFTGAQQSVAVPYKKDDQRGRAGAGIPGLQDRGQEAYDPPGGLAGADGTAPCPGHARA